MTWPDDAFSGPKAPFVIGVLGTDPFGAVLDKAMKDCKVGDHPVVVERYATLEQVGSPQVLFVSTSLEKDADDVVKAFGRQPILLVGDFEGFARHGATANFYLDKQNVRFDMNPVAMKAARLKPSTQLLKLARIVG